MVSFSFAINFPFDFTRKGRKKPEGHCFFVYIPFLLSLDFEMGVGTYLLKYLSL